MLHVFIINPTAGNYDVSEQLRNHLDNKRDFDYIVFNTENEDGERDLVRRIVELFAGEQIRFYICGGSGSLAKALSALSDEDFKTVEIASYPCGCVNDYLDNFGNHRRLFNNIDNLINGEVIKVDYVESDIDNDERYGKRYMVFSGVGSMGKLNSSAKHFNLMNYIDPGVVYNIVAIINSIINFRVNYNVTIDGEDYSGEYISIFMDNSVCIRKIFHPIKSAHANDGYYEVILLKKTSMMNLHRIIRSLKQAKIDDKIKDYLIIKKAREICVSRVDNKDMYIVYDGETIKSARWHVNMVQGGVRFVVPKGVRVMSLRDILNGSISDDEY